jgi:MerR family transcriptional regulator, copper efflux regulator
MAATGTPAPSGGQARRMQIGEAAERVGLSIRTIRHYHDAGLIVPSARSEGGFRLYTDSDLHRLALVKRMKPLGFTLEEMRELLTTIDTLAAEPRTDGERAVFLDRLAMYGEAAHARIGSLREQLAIAEGFADTLHQHLERHTQQVG